MTFSFTTPPSRLTVTAAFRRTSGSSTRPAGGPRAGRPSRSSRSSPFTPWLPIWAARCREGWFCGTAPLSRQRSSGEPGSVRAAACAAELGAPTVPPRRLAAPGGTERGGITMACRRAHAPGCRMLQLAELGAREEDPPLIRAEVHKHGVVFYVEDDAEPVLVVGHLIVDGERLGRAHRSWRVERAAGQVAPGRGAGSLHSYHHAPFSAQPQVGARPSLPDVPADRLTLRFGDPAARAAKLNVRFCDQSISWLTRAEPPYLYRSVTASVRLRRLGPVVGPVWVCRSLLPAPDSCRVLRAGGPGPGPGGEPGRRSRRRRRP